MTAFKHILPLLFTTVFCCSSHAQHYKGKVTDESGNPLHGVHIYIPGSFMQGTVTHKDGSFEAKGKPRQTLYFSYIGKKEVSLQLNEKDTTNICIVMEQEITRLDEITVRKDMIINEYTDFTYIDDRYAFQKVAEEAKFPGGMDSLKSYLHHALIYPEEAFIRKEEGQVLVQFIIDATGKATRPQIKRSVSPALDAEAIRLIQAMPVWKPGKNRGRPVECHFLLPINFYIHEDYRQILIKE